jgi:hypothetical protein
VDARFIYFKIRISWSLQRPKKIFQEFDFGLLFSEQIISKPQKEGLLGFCMVLHFIDSAALFYSIERDW